MIFTLRNHALLAALLAGICSVNAQFEEPYGLPDKSDPDHGQSGFNNCRARYGDSNPDAMCQNLYINSIQDFCLFSNPSPGIKLSDNEPGVVAFCTKSGYGTRTIPPGTIHGASFVKSPDYVQITAVGDFTRVNVIPGDEGTEFDAHGPSNTQNPVGALVYTRAYSGRFERMHEWNSFFDATTLSVRACKGPNAYNYCYNRYDELGAEWNHPGRYEPNVWEQCDCDSGEFPGVYNGVRYEEGSGPVPAPHPVPPRYNCRYKSGLSGGQAILIPGSRRRSVSRAEGRVRIEAEKME